MIKRLALLTVTFLLGCVVAFAQAPAQAGDVSGKYEGSVKGPDEKVSLDLKSEDGKISGRLTSGTTALEVTEGTFKDGTLSLSFGKGATLTAKVQGDKIVGDWMAGTEKRAIELTKVPVVAAATATAAPFDLNGNWDAVADANGQPFPFSLTLKVDGETVSGSSSSQLGESAVKVGTWKDGKLAFQLEGQNGVVTLSAIVIEGKLSGEFDYSGQLQGRWVAVKKN